MNDEGVSELLGYSIMAGMVITAVICVTSGAAGVISTSAGQMSFNEAVLSMQSVTASALESARTNNTCPVASEVQVPDGYELFVMDGPDDVASISMEVDSRTVYAVSTGSIRMQSQVRSVSFEGGAVFSNDSGSVSIVRKPSVFFTSHSGRTALYLFLINISTDTGIIATGFHTVLDFRTQSQSSESFSTPIPALVTLYITSRDPGGWSEYLNSEGYAVTRSHNTVKATTRASDIYVTCTTLQVSQDG